jgi:hypothetical protein
MSKRKNRKNSTPNLPQETLDRARQEAGLPIAPRVDEDDEIEAEVAEVVEAPSLVVRMPNPDTARRRDIPQPAQSAKRKAKRKTLSYEDMTPEDVAYALENPTKTVSEESLREQYGYVLADLRSMGLLAAALFVALIVIAIVFI